MLDLLAFTCRWITAMEARTQYDDSGLPVLLLCASLWGTAKGTGRPTGVARRNVNRDQGPQIPSRQCCREWRTSGKLQNLSQRCHRRGDWWRQEDGVFWRLEKAGCHPLSLPSDPLRLSRCRQRFVSLTQTVVLVRGKPPQKSNPNSDIQ